MNAASCRFVNRRRRGQVLVMALLALLLLAGMVFYTFNLGDQVNRRVSMQNAADSAAISGANWMARSMNVVAMNNVAQTRLLTMAVVLDSLPDATVMSYEEMTEWLRGLDGQLSRGIPDTYLDQGLRSMVDRFRGEQARMQPLYDALKDYDPTPLTHWYIPGQAGAAPHGSLWVGAKALEDINTAAYESAGLLSQASGARMGEASILRDPDASMPGDYGSAFIVPVLPQMPARRGEFRDFRKPVMEGRPAEYEPNTTSDHFRRGPYDQLFEWRTAIYDQSRRIPIGRTLIQGTAGPIRNADAHGTGGKVVGTSVVGGPQDHYQIQYKTINGPQTGWNTYGVYAWAIRGMPKSSGLAHFAYNNLRDTNFMSMVRTLCDAKMAYMWGDTNPRTIHHPKWISTYPEARQFVGQPLPPPDPNNPNPPANQPTPSGTAPNAGKVKYTMFYMVQTKSSVNPTSGGYRSAGTYVTNSHDPQAIWLKGWVDPADWEARTAKKAVRISEWVWQIDWEYETTFDTTIGLQRQSVVPGGTPTWHTVYIREQYVFGGIDVGGDDVIDNPANFQSGDEPPRPYLLDLTKADYRSRDVPQYLWYMGVAQQTAEAPFWPHKFTSGNPYSKVVAIATAQVFNNQSWDLWTQDWQARLRPFDCEQVLTHPRAGWDDWLRQTSASPGDLATVSDYVDEEALMFLRRSLQSYDSQLVDQLITH